jgi:hypothetical protein
MDKAVKKQNKKQRHEARSGQEQSIGEEQAKRGEEQAKRGDVIGEEQSIGEPSPDQQSVEVLSKSQRYKRILFNKKKKKYT